MKFLPWSQDHWLSREGTLLSYDKLEHFLAAALGVWAGLQLLKADVELVFFLALTAGVAWEIKDALVAYNDRGDIQGFSWKDLIADFAGIVVGWLIASAWQM